VSLSRRRETRTGRGSTKQAPFLSLSTKRLFHPTSQSHFFFLIHRKAFSNEPASDSLPFLRLPGEQDAFEPQARHQQGTDAGASKMARSRWRLVEQGDESGSRVQPQIVIVTNQAGWRPNWGTKGWHGACSYDGCCTLSDVVRLLIPEVLDSDFKFISPPKNLKPYGTRASADFFLPKDPEAFFSQPPPYQSPEIIEYSPDTLDPQGFPRDLWRFPFESAYAAF